MIATASRSRRRLRSTAAIVRGRACPGGTIGDRPRAPEATIRALVIIPALNEGAALPGVLKALQAEDASYDVVVVDDGSTDDTAAVAKAGGAVVLSLPY